MLTRLSQGAVLSALVLALAGPGNAVPGNAEPPGPPVVDDPTGTVTTVIRLPGTPTSAPSTVAPAAARAKVDPCSYRLDPMAFYDYDFSRPEAPLQEQIEAGQVRWFVVSCPGQADYPTFTVSGQPGVGPPPPTPGDLAADARAVMQLPFPAVRHNPTDAGLVNLATWLWLDDSSWQVRTNTLGLRGTSVTVVAKPTRVDWVTGDGARVSCAGQGRPYDTRLPASKQSTSCSHTYRRSSAGRPGNAYQGSATAVWEIRWVGAAPGGAVQQGALPPLQLTTTFSLRVQEVQDLVTQAR